jgi:hypothetical protein
VEVVEVDAMETLQSETERVAAVAEEVPNLTELVQEVHQQPARGLRVAQEMKPIIQQEEEEELLAWDRMPLQTAETVVLV